MPYPNEHSCRLKSPDAFQPKSFRRMERPKGVSLIIARPKGKTTTATQAIRYDKDIWTADRAKTDCEEKGGSFEAAAKESEQNEVQEASWQDVISLEGDMEEAVFSFNDRRDILGTAVQAKFGKASDKYTLWVRDMWEEDLVYEDTNNRKFYKVSYAVGSDGKVTLGEPKQVLVQTTYEELSEAATIKAQIQKILQQADALLGTKDLPDAVVSPVKAMRTALHKTWKELAKSDPATEEAEDIEIAGDFIALVEAIAGSEVVHLKIIEPGWGSAGYYSTAVLEQAAPIYKKGTHMFWDHPTLSEEKERPERTIRDLAGALISDGRWDSGGSAGPGIYADAKVFGPYKDAVTELAPHIGVSHRALGKAKKGEAEGQKGNIIEQITAAQSVDFVTSPGAGGKVLQIFESAKGRGAPIETNTIEKEAQIMTDEEKVALEGKLQAAEKERDDLRDENVKLKEENARLSENLLLIDATAFVTAEIKETQIPDLTRQRLIETMGKNPPVKEGKLDEEAFKETIKQKLAEEVEYLSKVTKSGEIRGMGDSASQHAGTLKESFKTHYLDEGKSEEDAERLATFAAEGR